MYDLTLTVPDVVADPSQAMWDPTTPFSTALGPLGLGSGIRTLALRVIKADNIVGLTPGLDEELKAPSGSGDSRAREWARTGKWAVVQFCDGKVGILGAILPLVWISLHMHDILMFRLSDLLRSLSNRSHVF